MRLFFEDEAASRAKTDADREEMLSATVADVARTFESLLTPTDAAVLTGEMAEFFVYSAREGLELSSEGWWEDSCMLQPWGFSLADIGIPVMVMHGREDRFVPFAHGEWLAKHVPGAEVRLLDHDGHLTLFERRVPEVHAWLAEHL
jgi:pimeloyl-ACP methyl ester carboxylesterase